MLYGASHLNSGEGLSSYAKVQKWRKKSSRLLSIVAGAATLIFISYLAIVVCVCSSRGKLNKVYQLAHHVRRIVFKCNFVVFLRKSPPQSYDLNSAVCRSVTIN